MIRTITCPQCNYSVEQLELLRVITDIGDYAPLCGISFQTKSYTVIADNGDYVPLDSACFQTQLIYHLNTV